MRYVQHKKGNGRRKATWTVTMRSVETGAESQHPIYDEHAVMLTKAGYTESNITHDHPAHVWVGADLKPVAVLTDDGHKVTLTDVIAEIQAENFGTKKAS